MESVSLLGLEIDELREALGPEVKLHRARQVYKSLYADRAEMPAAGHLREANRYESTDGTVRYLLGLGDGKTIETVFIPEGDRDTICISSQVGCPIDCKFCLTGLLGLERNLTAGEIVGQVLHVMMRHDLHPKKRTMNIVMMGQGEPLMNLDNVLKATRLLVDQRGIGMGERRITLSTSGLIPKIEEMGRAAIRPRLAISLNASSEEQRREIMPITDKWHLRDLLDACRRYPLRPKEYIFVEYVLLGGVNDTDADAGRLVALLKDLHCKVNLIPLNPGPGIPFVAPTEERVQEFQRIVMREAPCYVRRARGQDIYAACGQLKRMSELVTITGPSD